MYVDKGIVTEEEQVLISRYPVDLQENLKEKILKIKSPYSETLYELMIKTMEMGRKIIFLDNITLYGDINPYKIGRMIYKLKHIKPTKEELEWDDRLEEFKQYPYGTRIKANGVIIYSKED